MSSVLRLLLAFGLCLVHAPVYAAHVAVDDLPGLKLIDGFAEPSSSSPRIEAIADGSPVLSWLERGKRGRYLLRYALLEDGEITSPRTAASGKGWFANWADRPGVARGGDGTLLAFWLRKNGQLPYGYDLNVSVSRDDGATWTLPAVPHLEGTERQHGFASVAAMDDRMVLVWLDGRAVDTALYYAFVDAQGLSTPDTPIDDRTCTCCKTAATVSDGRPVVVYRDRTAEEIRDIYVARYDRSGWVAPRRLSFDEWRIGGCPVNGPAVDAKGEAVVAAWYTGADGRPRVKAAFSGDGGETFGAPVLVSDDQPLGRVDVVLVNGQTALVSWVEWLPSGAEIHLRWVDASGSAGRTYRVANGGGDGFPQMARAGEGLLFSWTRREPSPGVVAAAAEIPPASR